MYSIGIYTGGSPFDLKALDHMKGPVLTRDDVSDVPATYVADPFMVRSGQTWFMFFEVLNGHTGKGEIGYATSQNGIAWTYQRIVLAESFHLSYPYVFEHRNEYYMIPESHQTRSVRLYKAARFPSDWAFVGTLLGGRAFSDSSIFRYDGKWWLYSETNPQYAFDTLRLYYADDLPGPWVEHPASPVVTGNAQTARPGGRVLTLAGTIIRYAQDCVPAYGTGVRAFEITELTTSTYKEREALGRPVLCASGRGWNAHGMHHLDPHRVSDGSWLASVDGWSWAEV